MSLSNIWTTVLFVMFVLSSIGLGHYYKKSLDLSAQLASDNRNAPVSENADNSVVDPVTTPDACLDSFVAEGAIQKTGENQFEISSPSCKIDLDARMLSTFSSEGNRIFEVVQLGGRLAAVLGRETGTSLTLYDLKKNQYELFEVPIEQSDLVYSELNLYDASSEESSQIMFRTSAPSIGRVRALCSAKALGLWFYDIESGKLEQLRNDCL